MKSPFRKPPLTAFLTACLLVTACTQAPTDDDTLALAAAHDFSTHYFNLRFDEAYAQCTPESRPWLLLRASTLTEQDLNMRNLAATDTHVEVRKADERPANDSCAWVWCTAHNVLVADSLGRPARMYPKATYRLPLRKRNGTWRVHLTAPLRAE